MYLCYCDVIDAKHSDRPDEVFTPDCVGGYRDSRGKVQEGLAFVHFYAAHSGAGAIAGKLCSVWRRHEDEPTCTENGWRISRHFYRNYVNKSDETITRSAVPQRARRA